MHRGARLADLSHILDAAPFGLTVSANGRTLFANPAAAVADPDRVQIRSFEASEGGQSFRIDLALDETETLRAERRLVRKVYFDELTGLPRQPVIEQSIQSLLEEGQFDFALALIELDDFNSVRDHFGRAIADRVVAALAARLADRLTETDLLARLSGSEFLLLLSPVSSKDELTERIEDIARRIRDPFAMEGHEVFVSASIGISLAHEGIAGYERVAIQADQALARAKAKHKGSICFFDKASEDEANARSRLEQIVRAALLDRRIRCAYQPKVDIYSGQVEGVEVLMRWVDEDAQNQAPGAFLKLATELGLIGEVTGLVLDETIEVIDRLNEAFGSEVAISFNVAANLAGNVDYMRSLVGRIVESGFADRFVMEVTEEAFFATQDFQAAIVPMIRSAGIGLSIDDFGTGYSSLSVLAGITADELKIDRSFITNVDQRPRNQSILRAIEALGATLGMRLIAEGVETAAELAYLKRHTTIRLAQGYYFSKPLMLDKPAARSPGPTTRPALVGRVSAAARTR